MRRDLRSLAEMSRAGFLVTELNELSYPYLVLSVRH